MNDLVKITFVGDLMCQKEQLTALAHERLGHDFAFERVKVLFDDSDYVVGNLESPIAGKDLRYTFEPARFNTPKEFIHSLRNIGFSFFSTANNHCLDRGVLGIDKTLHALREENVDFSGTYSSRRESEQIFTKQIGGITFAFLCFTYGTNSEYTGLLLPPGEEWRVDLLKTQTPPPRAPRKTFRQHAKAIIHRLLPRRLKLALKGALTGKLGGIPDFVADNVAPTQSLNPKDEQFVQRAQKKIAVARASADIVVVLPHVGGQYNPAPGFFQRKVMHWLSVSGADLIIAGHAHTSLRCEVFNNGVIGAYALGNFCFTPGKGWFIPNTLAEYGIVFNVFIDKKTKKISKASFSVTKSIVLPSGISQVVPVDVLYAELTDELEKERLMLENEAVVNRFRGSSSTVQIQREYSFEF